MRKVNGAIRRDGKGNAVIFMAKRLKLDLGGFGSYQKGDWDSPLPEFIRMLYHRRFGIDKEERGTRI